MVRSLEDRLDATAKVDGEVDARARARLLLVGDFSASKVGNASVVEELAPRLRRAGDLVTTTSAQPRRLLRIADMVMTTFLARNRIDVAVVDVFSGSAFRWAEMVTALLRGARVPVIHVLRGGNLPDFAEAHRARVERLMAGSNAIVALSGYLFERMSAYGEVAEVIPNPIDLSAYQFRLRRRVAPRVAWLRTFNEIYNPTLGPRMIHELRPLLASGHRDLGAGGDDIEPLLNMVGADSGDGSRQESEAVAKRLDVDGMVMIVGPIPKSEVPSMLGEHDIFINTADVDNFPISVVEALACGLCVVSTEAGGMPYLLQDGVDALLVPRDDPRAMAGAVAKIVSDPDLAERLSRNGRAKAESFDWARILPQWRDLIVRVASRKGDGS